MLGKPARAGKVCARSQTDRSVSNCRSPTFPSLRFLAPKFPRLGVFPRCVPSMVKMQKQAFAAVKESQPNKVVVDKRRQRSQNDIGEAEAAVAFGDRHLRPQGGEAGHMVE